LYLVTASVNGDTIVWISVTGGTIVGGNYWVTGGPFKGQTGIWNAHSETAIVSSAPLQTQVAVEILDQSQGLVGERLVYFVRETIRRSTAFRLMDTSEPRIQIIIQTMPRFEDDPNTSTMYSVVWNLVVGDETSGWTTVYLDNTIGYAGRDVVSSSAETIVARTDRLITDALRQMNNR